MFMRRTSFHLPGTGPKQRGGTRTYYARVDALQSAGKFHARYCRAPTKPQPMPSPKELRQGELARNRREVCVS